MGSTHHNERLPGLGDAVTAEGAAVEEVDALGPCGEGRRGEDALGEERRGGEGLEGDHCVRLVL